MATPTYSADQKLPGGPLPPWSPDDPNAAWYALHPETYHGPDMSKTTSSTTTPTGSGVQQQTNQTQTPTSTGITPTTVQSADGIQVTPGSAVGNAQINVADYGGQLATNPNLNFDDSMTLGKNVPEITDAQTQAGSIDPNNPNLSIGAANADNATTTQATHTNATAPAEKNAVAVQTALTNPQVLANQITGAQGQINQNDLVTAPQIDTAATAAGQTPTGAALGKAAQQNISNIIDTTTSQGKLLAQQLGEGNYTDSKATLQGQLAILQSQFTDPTTGEPTIPAWASGTARNVSRIAAFKGMTGTAATAAMAQALMEASLPIAQSDAQFFQTVTLQNLSNRQQSVINTANVLANMDMANLNARETAAVTNAQSFMQMDMKNLDNDQQAAVINNQERYQSILTDAAAENANRLFVAQSQNEKDQFYDQLGTQISQFNASQADAMSQYNAGQSNATAQFNATLENNRQQFYANNQFQIDTANAEWRQKVTLTNNTNDFQAAATDVKNRVDLSNEQLNQLWDRADSLLDYVWKSADNSLQRQNNLAVVALKADKDAAQADQEGFGKLLGTIAGTATNALFNFAFGL